MSKSVKYKLIKDYPGSPCQVGEIVSNSWAHLRHLKIEEFPEYWEKVLEKDYEVLAYQYLGSGIIITKSKNRLFGHDGFGIKEARITGARIHSVKRLSDGKVFTVGDEVIEGVILAFNRTHPNTLIYTFHTDETDWRLLSNAKKVSKDKEQIEFMYHFLCYVEDNAYYNSGGWIERDSGDNISREQLAQDFLKQLNHKQQSTFKL